MTRDLTGTRRRRRHGHGRFRRGGHDRGVYLAPSCPCTGVGNACVAPFPIRPPLLRVASHMTVLYDWQLFGKVMESSVILTMRPKRLKGVRPFASAVMDQYTHRDASKQSPPSHVLAISLHGRTCYTWLVSSCRRSRQDPQSRRCDRGGQGLLGFPTGRFGIHHGR